MRTERLAVVSDIHGNLPALEAVIAEIAAAGVLDVVNLGDIVSGPLWPAETADRLMALGWPTIAGNHERQLLAGRAGPAAPATPAASLGASDAHAAARLRPEHHDWLAALPATRWLADDLFCCHGTPTDDLRYLLETVTPDLGQHGSTGLRAAHAGEIADRLVVSAASAAAAASTTPLAPATLLLCGHSHVPRMVQQGALWLVNPGSVGLQAFDDEHPHGHRAETGSPLARWALLERAAGGLWRVQLRATPYDWEAAARQAELNGRGDWADALRCGRVGRLEREVLGR